MEDSNTKISFTVSNNSVTHLGRNLYNSTPPALAELVANSYDAYATSCHIILDQALKQLIIADNGKGMSIEEIEDKYATIGKKKTPENTNFGLNKRRSMGKKGIGKLASFSIGEEYVVYSKTESDDQWLEFTLVYSEMIGEDIEYPVDVSYRDKLPDGLNKFDDYDHGFIVVIKNLRRKITTSTISNTKMQLSRRFYLNSNNAQFTISLNDAELDLSTNDYYQFMELIYYFGYTDQEINDIFESDNIEKRLYNSSDPSVNNYIIDNKIKGWIGSVTQPKHLKDPTTGNNNNNIIVYMNGKIADEDIMKNNASSRIANQYIVGEIQADNLDDQEYLDPVTSSRQGLDSSIDEVQDLIKNIETIRNFVIEQWNDFRNRKAVDSLPERIRNHVSYKEWLHNLDEKEQKLNNKLINLIAPTLDAEGSGIDLSDKSVESMVTAIANVINNVEISELSSLLGSTDDNEVKVIGELLNSLMHKVEQEENLSHVGLIKSRLEVIETLARLMDDPKTLEKHLDEHLSDNPWLIDPYWNIDRSQPEENIERFKQQYFKSINSDGEVQRNFLDMLVFVAEEDLPIIVEYKKNMATGYANVSFTDIYDQIDRYREAVIQNYDGSLSSRDIKETDIKAIFIISEDTGPQGSGNKIELKDNQLEILKNNNIKILKYNEILNNARNLYNGHLAIIRGKKIIPDFTIEETANAEDTK